MRVLKRRVIFSVLLLGLGCGGGEPPQSGLKLMSYNILYRLKAPGDTLDLIERWDPDVLCLQELTPTFQAAFDEALGPVYPYRVTSPQAKTWGIGLFSKRPIQGGELRPQLPDARLRAKPEAPYQPHTSLGAWGQIPYNDGLLTLSCHHLMPPQHQSIEGNIFKRLAYNEATRVVESEVIAEAMGEVEGPAVVLGDMNAWGWNPGLNPIEDLGFESSCDLGPGPCGSTFPHRGFSLPLSSRIDHIFLRGVEVLWNETIKEGESDHLPVMVWLEESRGGSANP